MPLAEYGDPLAAGARAKVSASAAPLARSSRASTHGTIDAMHASPAHLAARALPAAAPARATAWHALLGPIRTPAGIGTANAPRATHACRDYFGWAAATIAPARATRARVANSRMWTVRGTRAALNVSTVAPEPIGLDVVAAAALALAQRAPRVSSRLPALPIGGSRHAAHACRAPRDTKEKTAAAAALARARFALTASSRCQKGRGIRSASCLRRVLQGSSA